MADGCGGELLGPSGIISYPEFGEDGYDIGMDCYWTITVQEERTIELKFEMIDIEEDDTCKYDFVQVSKLHTCSFHSDKNDLDSIYLNIQMNQLMRLWYLSHRRSAKNQASLRIATFTVTHEH